MLLSTSQDKLCKEIPLDTDVELARLRGLFSNSSAKVSLTGFPNLRHLMHTPLCRASFWVAFSTIVSGPFLPPFGFGFNDTGPLGPKAGLLLMSVAKDFRTSLSSGLVSASVGIAGLINREPSPSVKVESL